MNATPGGWSRLKGWFYRDEYSLAGYLLFLAMVATQWRVYVRKHEAIYLLGSLRVRNPDFLAGDLSWSTLPPTTFLFDHLLAPLGALLSDFGIVTVGRLVTWALLAGSLALLARTLKLPWWSMAAGFTLFLLTRQSILACGSFLEGFQPKSFAYSLVFFAVSFAIRGQVVRAGVAAGLATAFHIIIGGWGCLALFSSLLIHRATFSNRQLATFLLATSPFVVPLVLSVGLFHAGGLTGQEGALMDEIYVTFAQPHCLDPTFFLSDARWSRVLWVFPLALALLFLWPKENSSRIVAWFASMLIGFFFLGMLASSLDLYSVLKVYPFQWAAGASAMFLFVMVLAHLGAGLPKPLYGKAVWALALVVAGWLAVDRDLTRRLLDIPENLLASPEAGKRGRYGSGVSTSRRELYAWIRQSTSSTSVFVTPYLPEFWTYAGREQVAAFRHPPHDRRLIEWKRRLEELNGSKSFDERGFAITDELDDNQPRLLRTELRLMRERYGATHYLTRGVRDDLANALVFSAGRYSVYDLSVL